MKRLLSRILSVLFLLFLALGVKELAPLLEKESIPPRELLVGFSQEKFSLETPLISLAEWEEDTAPSPYRALGSEVHYNALSPQEKTVYRLLEACRDSATPYLFVDSRLLAECERSVDEILTFLSLDSPLVEQNLSHSRKEYSRVTESGITREVRVNGMLFHIRRFSREHWEKKTEALEEARRLVAATPSLPQMETARYFYSYLTQEVRYLAYDKEDQPHYLYDALVQKSTQCDGFANAFSLLCNLAGIPCLEKVYEAPNPEEAGHTWNSFRVGDVWYNADCSLSEDAAADDKRLSFCSRFGFSDSLQSNPHSYEGIAPPCLRDLIPVVATGSPYDPELAEAVKSVLTQGKANVALVCLNEMQFDDDSLQSLANKARLDIQVVGFTWGEKNYYFVFRYE